MSALPLAILMAKTCGIEFRLASGTVHPTFSEPLTPCLQITAWQARWQHLLMTWE